MIGYVVLKYIICDHLTNKIDVFWTCDVIAIEFYMASMPFGATESALIDSYSSGSPKLLLWSSQRDRIYKCKVCEKDITL